jgi:putative membrane protein
VGAPADTSDTTKPTTTTPKGGLSDSNIVAILDEANKADSTAGAAALKKATNAQVKAFARLMMAEHHALRVEGQGLAKQLKLTPKPPERDPLAGYTRNEMVALQKTPKGAEFDRTYIDNEVAIHQAVLDFANQARVTTQTPELKELIQKAIPVIQKHLEQAQAVQKQLGPAA